MSLHISGKYTYTCNLCGRVSVLEIDEGSNVLYPRKPDRWLIWGTHSDNPYKETHLCASCVDTVHRLEAAEVLIRKKASQT